MKHFRGAAGRCRDDSAFVEVEDLMMGVNAHTAGSLGEVNVNVLAVWSTAVRDLDQLKAFLSFRTSSGPVWYSVVHSHWSRNVEACLSLVESNAGASSLMP